MGLLKWIYRFILGTHPYNTIFSYNYHNIVPLVSFLKSTSKQISSNGNLMVDIGAGEIPYYSIFSDVIERYIAIDMEGSMPENDPRPIEQKISAAESLPLDSEIADIVMSNQVLEHVLDPVKAVAESHRILKKGGLFIGSVPHISPVHLEPYDFRRFTDLGVRKLLEEAGFTRITIEGNSGVFGAAAMLVNMDIMLSVRKEGEEQKFSNLKAFLLFPVVGFINLLALLLDTVLPNSKRSPSNLCWRAFKE